MAIELEQIQPWDGQSGTGSDARIVIDGNFEKIKNELETVDSKLEETNEQIVQLAGEVDDQFIIKDLNNSWIQVAEGSDNDILYTSLVKDVNIWLDKSLYPDGVEISIGLIRN